MSRSAALLFALLLGGCRHTPAPLPVVEPLPVERLHGRWFVLASTFPMWAGGARTDVTFDYGALTPEEGIPRLSDRVGYRKGGEPDEIRGTDTGEEGDPRTFTWRGEGLLRLFSSRWQVAELAPDGSWALIHFESTLATPEGLDVIARAASLDEAARAAIRERLRARADLSKWESQLFGVVHAGAVVPWP